MRQSRLQQLGAYPFERLTTLLKDVTPNPELSPIDAGAGEPRLPLPDFVEPALKANLGGFSKYPSTRGGDALRTAIADWLIRRYGLTNVDPATQVLSANGTREALFAVAHALIDPEAPKKPYVMMPNPMYQIYFGAAITAGGIPYLLSCTKKNSFAPKLDDVPDKVWANTALVYVCSPSNPTGWVADATYFTKLLELADKHDFAIVSDECYSEIYPDTPPLGLLEVAEKLGRKDFARCLVMNSLSKRSALPGLRSGFIAGDAKLIAQFAKLRSYTGPATPIPLQMVAAAAWSDSAHVAANLSVYRQSIHAFFESYGKGEPPAASFFLWLEVEDDEKFAKAAFEQQAVTVLPGSYLSCEDHNGIDPGKGYIRAALIDGQKKAAELAHRLKAVRL